MRQALKKAWDRCCRGPQGRLIVGPWGHDAALRNPEKLMEDFIAASPALRLNLWLQYRDLRRAFNALEGLAGPQDPSLLRVELPRN
jgi:hypothetical protein